MGSYLELELNHCLGLSRKKFISTFLFGPSSGIDFFNLSFWLKINHKFSLHPHSLEIEEKIIMMGILSLQSHDIRYVSTWITLWKFRQRCRWDEIFHLRIKGDGTYRKLDSKVSKSLIFAFEMLSDSFIQKFFYSSFCGST